MSRCRCKRSFTRYLEATGNTAPIKNVDLVARVQGFLQSIEYKDGAFVKEGTPLFTIEPETYKLKLEQAQAAETGAQATLRQAEADFKRQQESGAAAGRFPGHAGYFHLDARQRAGEPAAGPGQHQDRGGQLRLYQCGRAVRRRRQRASRLRRRTRRRVVADAARHHRGARPDLGEFQRQRTGRAADPRGGPPARDDGGRSPAIADRGRIADRDRLSAQGQARLCRRDAQPVDRHASGARRAAQFRPRVAAGILCARPRARSIRSRMRCSCRTWRSAATRPDAICWS